MNFDYTDIFVAISTPNIKLLAEFYSKILHIQPAIDRPFYAEFQLEKLRLGIFKPKLERQSEFDNQNSAISLQRFAGLRGTVAAVSEPIA